MVDKTLTPTEVKWRYLTINWELRDLFPDVGTRIKIKVGGKTIEASINKRRRIRSTELFKVLKLKIDDVISITARNSNTFEISLKHR